MPGPGTVPDRSGMLLSADVAPPAPASPAQAAAPAGSGPRGRRAAVPRWLPPAICGLAGLVSGACRLGVPSLWRDEAATIEASQRPVPQIFALLHHVDAVNGAYYLLMHPVMMILGDSAAAVRLPSVAAMALAAVCTASLGRRLAELAGLPAPALTGLLAGLLFTAVPEVTRYAQEARAYGIVTMLATIAAYLLLRALAEDRWRWWGGYGIVIAAAGLLNVFSLLLLLAHGLSLALASTRAGAAPGVSRRQFARWGTVAATATAALSPLLVVGYRQRAQIAWIGQPHLATIIDLASGFAGLRALVLPVTVIAACGALAGATLRHSSPVTPGVIALPWLTAPAVTLLAASWVHPVFDARYVLYSLPALSLLCAAGLSWLAGLAARAPLGGAARPLAWLPTALIVVIFAVMLAGPQRAARLPYSPTRNDNLRHLSAILATREHRGDAVFYLPVNRRIITWAYPAPFRQLNDVALRTSPVASATLTGTEVDPALLRRRFTGVRRVWLITLVYDSHPQSATDRQKITLIGGMRLARRWRAGAMILRLYTRA